MFRFFQLCLAISIFIYSQCSMIYLDNCTYSIDLYQEYLNLLWSSNDSRTLHIQAVYAFRSNQSLIPGQISTFLSQSVALIPLFVRCTYPFYFDSMRYLPFTQCSSTIINLSTKKNYESTRTFLNHRSVLSLKNVPLLYTGEYDLLLFNCSFQYHSRLYQFQPKDRFLFHIEYERPMNDSCSSCNRRTSFCRNNRCLCRSGTLPMTLIGNKQFCIDQTANCSLDYHRCLNNPSISIWNSRWIQLIFLLFLPLLIFIVLVLLIFYCFYRRRSTHTFDKHSDQSLDRSIYMIQRHERTPSTISRTDSTKLSDCQAIDSSIFTNEYISQFYDDYPRVLAEQNRGDIFLILA